MTPRRKAALFMLVYFTALVIVQMMARFSMRLSYLILLVFPLALMQRNAKRFLLDWAPFYIIIVLYDSFRGVIDDITPHVDFLTLPILELRLFGILPTVWLQQHWGEIFLGPFGFLLAIFYFGHFLLPVITLYLLWQHNPRAFHFTMAGITLLSVLGFITYLAFPAAPPWMAAQMGHIPPVDHMIVHHLKLFNTNTFLPRIYTQMNPNPVAAFPSLHAGYPFMLLLCIHRFFPKYRLFYLINFIIVAFTITAFGEHYIVDILGGMLYAYIAFLILRVIWRIPLQGKITRSGSDSPNQTL